MARAGGGGRPLPAQPRYRSGFVPVPWLGTSWVDRGPAYRQARVLAWVVMGLGTLLAWGMSAGFVVGALQVVGPLGTTLVVAYLVVGVTLGLRFGWDLSGSLAVRAPRFPVLVLPIVLPFVCGALLAVVVAWSLPVVPVERAAQQASGHAWKQWAHDHPEQRR
ncbi:hypothetical protein GCM10027596_04400 [Nocardioides korecus]